jgi:transcriptional regulator with XRE-family HTH domain
MLRMEKGLRQKDIAEILGKNKTTISAYEKGIIKPPYEIVLKLKRILDYYEDDLLTIVDEKPNKKRIYKPRKNKKSDK